MRIMVLLFVLLLVPVPGNTATERDYRLADGQTLRLEQVAADLGVPWGMVFLNPEELLITERHGRLGIIEVRQGSYRPLAGVPPVLASGQGGLLDVAAPNGYRSGDFLYFTYSKEMEDGRGATTLARARLVDDSVQDWTDLLVTRSATGTGRHYGSRIAFDSSGHVFFSIGDRGVRESAQDLGSHAGTVIRLNLDGSVPPDNPLVGVAGALPEIWSWGHRNIQGLVFDTATDRLWAIEHGPRGGDELNLIRPGKNYGWPVVSHGMEYWGPVRVGEAREKEGIEPPVKVYTPSIAPGSLLLYDAEAIASWRGNLLAGSLVLRHLNRITVDAQGAAVAEQRLLEDLGERIRALALGPAGGLYLSTDSGRILRLAPVD